MKKVLIVLGVLLPMTAAVLWGLSGGRTDACCVYGQPPTIASVTADPGQCWPPNHKMVDVVLTATGSPGLNNDGTTAAATWTVSSVQTQDVGEGAGDPSNDPDWASTGVPVPFPGQPQIVQLRCERGGPGDGRVYTVSVTATNSTGSATGAVNFIVPHDMRDK
jgi:hypothetical protein